MKQRIGSVLALVILFTLHWACGSNNAAPTTPGPSGPTYTYPFLIHFGDYGNFGSGNGQFHGPCALAIYHNALFAVDQSNIRLEKFDLNGNYLGNVALGGSAPNGLTLDNNGVLYVADWNANTITKYDQNLNSLGTFTPSIATSNPEGMAVDSANRIYITDGTGGTVLRCNNNGASCVSITGIFSFPTAVAVDAGGNVYIEDGVGFIQKFNSSLSGGSTIVTFGMGTGHIYNPQYVVVDPDENLLVSDRPSAGRLQKFSPTGSYIASISAPVSEAFDYIDGIAFDPNKNLYVGDYGKQVIFKYASY